LTYWPAPEHAGAPQGLPGDLDHRLPAMPVRRSEIATAKAQGHAALMHAIETCPDLESTLRRWWLQAEQTAERKPAAVRLVVFKRTGLLFELMADRAGWSQGRVR
jgi:hypothetical protein